MTRQHSTARRESKTDLRRLLSTGVLLFFSSAALLGENVMEVGSADGNPGARGLEVIVTASTDQPIHGYSIALSFPADVVELKTIGVEGTHVQALTPEFVAPRIDNGLGIATLGVIIDFNEPVTPTQLSATGEENAPHIIARLVFDVRSGAVGGLYPFRLVDGIGTPAAFNRFTNAGASIAPTLRDGAILVAGGNVMRLSKSIAIAGATPNLTLTLSALHPDRLDGFSAAIAFDCDPNVVEFDSSTYIGTDLDFLVGRPEFFSSGLSAEFPCRVETAVLVEYLEGEFNEDRKLPAAPGAFQSLMRYTFEIGGAADDVNQWQDLVLENLDNPVAANNLFVIGTQSLAPRRIHGKVYFSEGDLTGVVVDRMTGAPAPGVTARLDPDPCPQTSPGCRPTGTTDTNGRFRIDGLIPGVYTVKLSGPGYYNAVHEGVVIEGRFRLSDAGALEIFRVPTDGPSGSFIRGDTNNDGVTNIADAIFVLNRLFQGGPGYACAQAADANDDDKTDIADAIWMLNFFFIGGLPIPAPRVCGPDPNGGPLPCAESSCR